MILFVFSAIYCPCKLFCKICVRVMETNVKKIPHVEFWKIINGWLLYFDLRPGPKMLFQGDTPEGSDTFQWPVIERDHVGGLRFMIWDKVKVHCATTVMHRKRVTSELHSSYFGLMTIKHSISKIQCVIVWALNYYIIELSLGPRAVASRIPES